MTPEWSIFTDWRQLNSFNDYLCKMQPFHFYGFKVKIEFYHHCGKEMQRLHYKKPLLCSAWSLWWSLRRWQGEVHLGLVGHHNATSHSGQARIILFYKTPFSPSFSWHLSACCQLALGLIRESAHHTINFCTKSAFRYDSSHFPLDTLKNPSSIKHCTDRSHFFFNLRIISYQPTSLVLIRDTESRRPREVWVFQHRIWPKSNIRSVLDSRVFHLPN